MSELPFIPLGICDRNTTQEHYPNFGCINWRPSVRTECKQCGQPYEIDKGCPKCQEFKQLVREW